MKVIDLTGNEYGRLFVFERALTGSNRAEWLCLCDCGGVCTVKSSCLRQGLVRSCGCLRRSQAGLANTPKHKVWWAMVSRCTNPKDENYKNYGGRGITVTPRWLEFLEFYADMGPRPFPSAQLDRERNHEGYSLSNCRWTTRKVNARNTRKNVFVVLEGLSITLAEAAERTGVKYATLKYRHHHDLPLLKGARA